MARTSSFDYDVIVIGSGATGSTAALALARHKKRVALIEAGAFGGESPNWGDVPTKALLHAANLYDEARRGTRFGIRSSMLGFNYPSVLQWRDKAVRRTGAADNRKYYEKLGIDTFAGIAHFLSPNEVSVNRRHLTAAQFVVATGSHFDAPDVYGIETVRYLTPRTVLDLVRVPRSIFIVGSDSEAVEYAQLLATFGAKVYLSERANRLLPDEDSEVGELLASYLSDTKSIACLTESQIIGVEKKGLGVRVSYTRGGVSKSVHVDEILFTTNRTPSVDLGLENAHVMYTPAGIDVNEYLQTNVPHVHAGGNVTGERCPTHTALLHGRVIAHNILNKKSPIQPDTSSMPRITYTYPGIASVGLSENDCIRRDLQTNAATAPLSIVGRANTSDFSEGFVKIICDKKGVLLGATVVAPHAAEIIHELTLAIHHGMTAADVASTPHAFLSWSEAIRVAAAKLVR